MLSLPSIINELLRYFAQVATVAALLILLISAIAATFQAVLLSIRRRSISLDYSLNLRGKIVFAAEFLIISTVLEVLLFPTYLNLTKLAVFTIMRTALGLSKLY